MDAERAHRAAIFAAIRSTRQGRTTRPSTAATGRSWLATRRARSGTPRAPAPGCRTGWRPSRGAVARPGGSGPSPGSTGAVPKGRVSWPSPSATASSHDSLADGVLQHRRHVAARVDPSPRAGRPSRRRHPRRSGRRPGRPPRPWGPATARSRGTPGAAVDAGPPAWSRGSGASSRLAGDQGDEHHDGVVPHPPDRLLDGRQRQAAGPTRGCCRSRRPTARRGRRSRARRRPPGSPAPRCRWPRRWRSAARAGSSGDERPPGRSGRGAGLQQRLVDPEAGVRIASRKPRSRSWAEIRSARPETMPMRGCPRLSGGRHPSGRLGGCRRRPSAGGRGPCAGRPRRSGRRTGRR